MKQWLGFSIVINTLNRAPYLRNCLLALQYLRHPNFEVIVVNGPSTDETEEVMAQYEGRIIAGRCDVANLSKSRNIGIHLAKGDVVCFLDDDAYPEPDWLHRLEEAYADPRVGAVGGYIRDHSGVNFQCRITVCDRFGDSQAYKDISDVDTSDMGPGSWSFLSQTGCNSSFRRSALLEVGGFDEYFAYFLDETDVNLRIRDAGYAVTIAPDAEVHHKYAPSHLRDHKKVPSRLYFPLRSKAYYCIRHARGHKSLREIMDKLSAHAVEIHKYNKWYVENDVITDEHYKQLTKDVDEGLLHGVRDAMEQQQPKYMDPKSLPGGIEPNVSRFPTRLPDRNRLKLCLVSQDYPPNSAGGIGSWTHHVAEALAALGHEVSVVTKSNSGEHTVDFENGVWVHRINPVWSPKRTSPPLGGLPQTIKDYAYAVYDEVMRIHLRRGLDLVSGPIWDLEAAACVTSGVLPTVTSLHTTFQLALPYKPDWQANKTYRKEHVDPIIVGEREMLENAPHILANSQQILNDLITENPGLDFRGRAQIVHHGLPGLPIRSASQTNWNGNRNDVRFLFVGRLEHRKGADTLLKALPALFAAYPDAIVDIIGDDSQKVGKQTLKQQFEKKRRKEPWFNQVNFHGFQSDEFRNNAYLECDVFVAPSRYESFGLVFLEAMRSAKPCIGTQMGGIQEVVSDGETGTLVPSGDHKALSEAMVALARDPELRQRYGQAGLDRFQAHFTQDTMIDTLLDYYRSVLASETTKGGVSADLLRV